jgi:hypothetical protein
MRKLGVVPVTVGCSMPKGAWDLTVARGEKVVWTAPGAVELEIEFKEPRTKRKGKKPWNPKMPLTTSIKGRPARPGAPAVCSWAVPKGEKSKKWNYIAYTIVVTYANGGSFIIDPVVIIQP